MTSGPVLVSIGNTRTRAARTRGDVIEPSQVFENSDTDALTRGVLDMARFEGESSPVVIASVNQPIAGLLTAAIEAGGLRAVRLGVDVPIPMPLALENTKTVGQDRLLDALGAFARSNQACIVIDAGTAVTVDFVDGQGVFHGGAIAPGLGMMLRALHEQTAALPLVNLTRDMLPEENPASPAGEEVSEHAGKPPFGKDTPRAMALGVVSAVRGMARLLIDRYAEFYRAYPRIIATGGDAPLLFEHDPLIEVIVPDLALVGMLEALKRVEQIDEAGDDVQPDADLRDSDNEDDDSGGEHERSRRRS